MSTHLARCVILLVAVEKLDNTPSTLVPIVGVVLIWIVIYGFISSKSIIFQSSSTWWVLLQLWASGNGCGGGGGGCGCEGGCGLGFSLILTPIKRNSDTIQ
jgi:hypothetical protein